jgi:GGDEF domain-containing protein
VPADVTTTERLVRAARAAQQLCDALWESLHDELRDPSAERITELSERLAEVSSTVALLAAPGDSQAAMPQVEASSASPAVDRRAVPQPAEPPRADPRSTPDLRLAPHPPADSEPSREDERRSAPEPATATERSSAPQRPSPFERSATPGSPASFERSRGSDRAPAGLPPQPHAPVATQPIPTRAGDYTFTKLVDEHDVRAHITEPKAPAATEIEIRDVRREEGPSAWVSSVGRLLTRHTHDGLPFAVLLVEIVDVARLERSETPHELHGLVAQVESALGRGMRSSDELSRETLGRYWLVAPETNGTGARMLAERLARLVRTSASHRGVPLEVAIGIAVCPDDGTEAPALAARADLGVYSARATGRSIAHTDPPPQR